MNALDVIDVGRDAILVLLEISAPVLLIALIVGLAVALVQALTQIQEMTLAFVPKIIAAFLAMLVFLPYMIGKMTDFGERIADRIVKIGTGG